MGNKSLDYRQITVRLPEYVIRKLELIQNKYKITLQDAILIVLLEYFTLTDCETWYSMAESG